MYNGQIQTTNAIHFFGIFYVFRIFFQIVIDLDLLFWQLIKHLIYLEKHVPTFRQAVHYSLTVYSNFFDEKKNNEKQAQQRQFRNVGSRLFGIFSLSPRHTRVTVKNEKKVIPYGIGRFLHGSSSRLSV